jgi:putative flavoprotein involved in K+ transport
MNPSLTRVERYDTIVIGAGQAGLAAGFHLAQADADFIILDGATRVGDSWRHRWDTLRLFTPAAFSGLPGMPFPAAPTHLPDKDEVADYLERYAERFDLPIRHDTRVSKVERIGEFWSLETEGIRYESNHVIVATGPFHVPSIPAVAGRLDPAIRQMHSRDYRSPFDLPEGGAVLVVGAGNSGAQIAMELAQFRPVFLAGRSTGHVPRTLLGRDIFTWWWPILKGMTVDNWFGRTLRSRLHSGDALIGISARDLKASGARRVGRVETEQAGKPVADGNALDVRVVIWATGFRPDFSWIKAPVPMDGANPRTARGVVPEVPGLYFVGLRFQYRMTSALLGGVGDDAQYVVAQIASDSV